MDFQQIAVFISNLQDKLAELYKSINSLNTHVNLQMMKNISHILYWIPFHKLSYFLLYKFLTDISNVGKNCFELMIFHIIFGKTANRNHVKETQTQLYSSKILNVCDKNLSLVTRM